MKTISIEEDDFLNLENVDVIIQRKISNSLRKINQFLASDVNFITEKGDVNTNIIDQSAKKTYKLKDENLNQFFTLIENCRLDGVNIAFAEKQGEYSGIMLDFDLYQLDANRKITSKSFHKIIYTVFKILEDSMMVVNDIDDNGSSNGNSSNNGSKKSNNKSAQFDDSEQIFHAFIIQKPCVVKTDYMTDKQKSIYKDGFHLLIPEIQITRGYKRYIIDQIIRSNVLEIAFKEISLIKIDEFRREAEKNNDEINHSSNLSPPNLTLDKNSAHVPVMFYGNSNSGKKIYQLTYFCKIIIEKSTPLIIEPIDVEKLKSFDYFNDDNKNERNIVNFIYELSLNYNACINHYNNTEDVFNTKDDSSNKIFKKTRGHELKTPVKTNMIVWLKKRKFSFIDDIGDKIKKIDANKPHDGDLLLETDNSLSILMMENAEAGFIKQILDILPDTYYNEYDSWFKILCAIANTDLRFKAIGEWFSQKSPSYSPSNFEKIWNDVITGTNKRTDKENITKATLIHIAQTVNKPKFEEIRSNSYTKILLQMAYASEGVIEHANVAKLLKHLIGNKFVVDTDPQGKPGSKCWFEFVLPEQEQKHGECFKWRKEFATPSVLHMYMSDVIPKIYNSVEEQIKVFCDQQNEEGLANYHKKVRDEFKKSKNKLQNNTFQNGVLAQAIHRFLRRGFSEILDIQPNILGVGNGILEFSLKGAKLIKSFHEIKISKYTSVNYIPYNPNNPFIKTIEQMAHDIYPEEDFYNWVMCYYASCLTGKSKDKILAVWGPASCGKSTIVELVKTTLGFQYARKIPVSIFTEKAEKANEANSAKMLLNGILFAYASETKVGDTLNGSSFKELVSAEAQSARELFGTQKEFYNHATIYICSNHELKFDDPYDDALWRRFCGYRHTVKFVTDPDPNNPNEKKLNESFMIDYVSQPEYQEAMLSILVHYKEKLDREYEGTMAKVPSETMTKYTEEFRNKQDIINRFITEQMFRLENEEYCVFDDVGDLIIKECVMTKSMSAQSSYNNLMDDDELLNSEKFDENTDENNVKKQKKLTLMDLCMLYRSWFISMFSNKQHEVSDIDLIAHNFSRSKIKNYFSVDPNDTKHYKSTLDSVIVGWGVIGFEFEEAIKETTFNDF